MSSKKTVGDYFKDSPFSNIGGSLSSGTGQEDFVLLETHKELERTIIQAFRAKPISIRMVIGEIGGGKTWSFSWLLRLFQEDAGTAVLGIPYTELRKTPERGLTEAVFRSARPYLEEIISGSDQLKLRAKQESDSVSQYLVRAAKDEEAYSVLSGESGGRLPRLDGIRPPPHLSSVGSIELLMALFRTFRAIGYERVLLLLDEAETLFTAYGKRDLRLFSQHLRTLYDNIEQDRDGVFPRVQLLMAATVHVLMEVSPQLVGRPADDAGVVAALARRLDIPFLLTEPTQDEILSIAKHRIGEHRMRELGQPYIPYNRDAILYAWEKSNLNVGDFCKALQRMYEIASEEGAEEITTDHAKSAWEETSILIEEAQGFFDL